MARNGKIARIPRDIRNELNERLADGEQGKRLVEWLNGHPEVRDALDLDFDGRPVTEQNLSEWRQGGHQDWLRHQENLEWARNAVEEGEELAGEDDSMPLSDRVSPLAVLVLGKLIHAACAAAPDSPESRRELLAVVRELTALRVSDHRAARLKMDLRRWDEEKEKIEEEAQERELWEPINRICMLRARESEVRMMADGMTPEQEDALRQFLSMSPRSRPPLNGQKPVPPATIQPDPT